MNVEHNRLKLKLTNLLLKWNSWL